MSQTPTLHENVRFKNSEVSTVDRAPASAGQTPFVPSKATKARVKEGRGMNKGESIWLAMFAVGVPYSLWMFYANETHRTELRKRGMELLQYRDFEITIMSAVLLYFVKNVWERLAYPVVEPFIDNKHQGVERVQRTKRAIKWIFDFFWYSSQAVFGYYVFYDNLPTPLLGPQTCASMWRIYPFFTDNKWTREYYLIQLGGQLYKSLDQCLKKRGDSKFWEYFLHHYLAFILQVHSYIGHHTTGGIAVLIALDITDIFLSSLRAQEATKFKIKFLFLGYYILTLILWLIIRAGIYGACLLPSSWSFMFQTQVEVYPPRERFADPFFPVMLTVLYIMNLYWCYALILIGIKSLKSKSLVNSYDPTLLKEPARKKSRKSKDE